MLMYTCNFSLLAELFMCVPDLGHSSYMQLYNRGVGGGGETASSLSSWLA